MGLAVIWTGPPVMCVGGPKATITENAGKGTNEHDFEREAYYH